MNSSLYECEVMHHRLEPERYRFVHRMFMFYLDLDEVEALGKRLRWLSCGRFNLYSFRDGDHLQYGGMSLKESLLEYLRVRNISLEGGKIMLMTSLRTFGYVFNPVSFYFCFNAAGQPICAIAEPTNHSAGPVLCGARTPTLARVPQGLGDRLPQSYRSPYQSG